MSPCATTMPAFGYTTHRKYRVLPKWCSITGSAIKGFGNVRHCKPVRLPFNARYPTRNLEASYLVLDTKLLANGASQFAPFSPTFERVLHFAPPKMPQPPLRRV